MLTKRRKQKGKKDKKDKEKCLNTRFPRRSNTEKSDENYKINVDAKWRKQKGEKDRKDI